MSSNELQMFVFRFVGLIPSLSVMLLGAILAAKNLNLYPRACWALLGAIGLNLLSNLGLPFVTQVLLQTMRNGLSPQNSPLMFQVVVTLPYSLMAALSWGLVLFAIFDGRAGTLRYPPEDDPDRDILDR